MRRRGIAPDSGGIGKLTVQAESLADALKVKVAVFQVITGLSCFGVCNGGPGDISRFFGDVFIFNAVAVKILGQDSYGSSCDGTAVVRQGVSAAAVCADYEVFAAFFKAVGENEVFKNGFGYSNRAGSGEAAVVCGDGYNGCARRNAGDNAVFNRGYGRVAAGPRYGLIGSVARSYCGFKRGCFAYLKVKLGFIKRYSGYGSSAVYFFKNINNISNGAGGDIER